MIGFSVYLHTGAPVCPSGLSCQGTLGTGWLIIFTLLMYCPSFLFFTYGLFHAMHSHNPTRYSHIVGYLSYFLF